MKQAFRAMLASLFLVALVGAQSKEAGRTRDIYVSAVDAKGAPIEGLAVADVAVREDGAAREVLKVAPATAPIQIVLIVDDSQAAETAVPRMREGLPKFVDRLAGKAEIGIVTIGERPTSLVEHTTDAAALKKGIGRIFARPGAGSYLLDGIVEVLKGLKKREVERAHIVALTLESSTEFSNLSYEPVLDQLYASGVTLHVLAVGRQNSSMSDETRSRNQVIAEGTDKTGGRRDNLLDVMGIPEGLLKVADELTHQYVVTYGRPDTLIPPSKIQVTTSRPGVTIRARQRLAGK